MRGLRATGIAELALRLCARRGRGDWLALVVSDAGTVSAVARELGEEMEALGDLEVDSIAGAPDALVLSGRLGSSQRAAVVYGLDDWPDAEWEHLDELRSRLVRDERTVLVMTMPSLERIMRRAPNLASWLGASVWSYQKGESELTEEQRERRLEALRAWAGCSDAEMLARAEAGILPAEPEFAEWLVLLGRGELLAR